MKRRLVIFSIICVFLLAGCGETEESNSGASATSYEMAEYTVPYFGSHFAVVDKNVYYVYENPEFTYFLGKLDLTTGETEERGIYFAEKCNIGAFTVDSEGNSYYYIGIEEGEWIWNGYFAKLSKDGELVYKKPFPKETFETIGMDYRIKVKEDEVITYGGKGRAIMDGQGEISSIDQVIEEEERGKYGAFQGAMYYNKEPFSYEKIFDLIDFGIEHDFLSNVVHYEDGMFVGWYMNAYTGCTAYVFTPCEGEVAALPQSTVDTELTLAVLEADSMVKAAVVDFNKSQSDIHITIKEYAAGGKSVEDGYAELNAGIAAGNAPDIIALGPDGTHSSLVGMGILENLQPYVDNSKVVHEEDYLKPAWEIGKDGDFLYGIPTEFSVQTIAGKSSLVGERCGIDFPGIRSLHEKHPDMALLAEESKLGVFSLCISFQAPVFIDYEKGTADFDKEEFYELLAFSDGFPEEAGKDGREALLHDCYLYSIDSFMQVYRDLGTKQVTFIGYPTADGSVGCYLNQGNYMYGICSRSKHKEACWEFIESYLTKHFEQKLPIQYSARKDVIRKQFEEEFEKHGGGYEGFELEEACAAFETICEQAGDTQKWDEVSAEILFEELQPYFAGEKTAGQTVEIIQNRVQTYLNETQ